MIQPFSVKAALTHIFTQGRSFSRFVWRWIFIIALVSGLFYTLIGTLFFDRSSEYILATIGFYSNLDSADANIRLNAAVSKMSWITLSLYPFLWWLWVVFETRVYQKYWSRSGASGGLFNLGAAEGRVMGAQFVAMALTTAAYIAAIFVAVIIGGIFMGVGYAVVGSSGVLIGTLVVIITLAMIFVMVGVMSWVSPAAAFSTYVQNFTPFGAVPAIKGRFLKVFATYFIAWGPLYLIQILLLLAVVWGAYLFFGVLDISPERFEATSSLIQRPLWFLAVFVTGFLTTYLSMILWSVILGIHLYIIETWRGRDLQTDTFT